MNFIAKSLLGIVALAAIPATTASAEVRCNIGQGHRIVLDWGALPTTNQPVLIESLLNKVGDTCINGETIYTLKGFPGEYRSKKDTLEAFKYTQALRRHGFTSENIGEAMKYIETIEEAAGDPEGKQAPMIIFDKSELALSRWEKERAAEARSVENK